MSLLVQHDSTLITNTHFSPPKKFRTKSLPRKKKFVQKKVCKKIKKNSEEKNDTDTKHPQMITCKQITGESYFRKFNPDHRYNKVLKPS